MIIMTYFRRLTLLISLITIFVVLSGAQAFAAETSDDPVDAASPVAESVEASDDTFDAMQESEAIKAPSEGAMLQADPEDPADPSEGSETGDPADPSDTPEDPEDPVEPEKKNGWITEDGNKYYYVDDVKLTGMQNIGKYWYYLGKKGAMQTGWVTLDGDKYYFDLSSGKRKHGKEVIDGSTYYFDDDGKMVRGWITVNGKKFYHSKKTGKRLFAAKKIGKFYYYFSKKSGAMKKGWLKLKGKKYYYNKKGHKLFGAHKIGKKTYYFTKSTGARIAKSKYYLYNKIWNKSSSTKYLIYVSKGGRWVNIFRGKKKNWNIIKRFRCSIGAPSTPTPSGTFRVTCKVNHFGEGKGYTCWYATGFIGSTYLMHSVVCYRGTKTVSDGRLGKAISHGCVRMKMKNANWIYNNIPIGSTVYIK